MTRPTAQRSLGGLIMLSTIAGAAVWTLQPFAPPLAAQTAQSVPGMEHALQLSNAFRNTARSALPALVSIQTTGRVVRESIDRDMRSPFENDELFRRFFGNDPRLRPFLERHQGGPIERERRLPSGRGSGFIISADGTVMTNTHVVRDAEEVTVRLEDGREFTVGRDNILMDGRSDVAVIQLDVDEDLPFVPLGNDSEMEIGDWVLALGSPFGLHKTVTQGIISAKGRGLSRSSMTQEFLQTDAAINPGNSGGPLVNLRGEVIGINTAISTASGGYDGVGFAIPVSKARWVADQLVTNGKVERGFLGIEMQPIDASLARHLDLTVPRGIVVTTVIPGGAAEAAGFQVGDVILNVDGHEIRNNHNMLAVVEQLRVGDSCTVHVMRQNKKLQLNITVAARPSEEELVLQPERSDEGPDSDAASSSNRLGVGVQNLTPELSERLNATTPGVVITSVEPATAAAAVGLEPRMIISRVGDVAVTDVDTFRRAIDASQENDVLLLVHIPTQDGERLISRFVLVPLDNA